MYALYQLMHIVVKWTRTASVIRAELDKLITTLRLSDIPPARSVPEATPATSDEEDRRNSRTVRFLIPPSEAVEQALVS